MKKTARIIAGSVMMLVMAAPFAQPRDVQAAACANVSSFGAVTIQVPVLEHIKDRVIWVRMQTPNESAKVLVDINEEDCLEIGGQAQQVNAWQWFAPNDNSDGAATYSFRQHDNNELKIIGIQPGVRVDKVLVTDDQCVPQDFGNNCQAATMALTVTQEQDYTVLPPPANGPFEGKVRLTDTPHKNQGQLKEVLYQVSGQVVQQSSDGYLFDTVRVKNGTHTVYITTVLQDGTQIKEMTVIEVKNPENPMTAFMRWAKLNQRALQAAALITLGALTLFTVLWIFVIRRKKRRLRLFHGL